MRRVAVLVWFTIAAGVLLTAQNSQIRAPQRFRSSVEIIGVNATVRDSEGRLIGGLTQDAFEVFDDGDPQVITQFTSERVPISLGVLVDVSDSMFGRRIKDAREAVERFLFEMLQPEDEYFVMTFNHRPKVLTTWTDSPEVVRHALDIVKPTGGTAVYDAVIAATPMFARRNRERAAMVIISDGADTASDATVREVRTALTRNDAFVYAIAIDSGERQAINTRVNPAALQAITDDSGGRTEVVRSTADLDAAAARIAEELNSQYLMAYVSPRGADGQFHSLRLRVRGTDYKVRTRNGYVASPAAVSGEGR